MVCFNQDEHDIDMIYLVGVKPNKTFKLYTYMYETS